MDGLIGIDGLNELNGLIGLNSLDELDGLIELNGLDELEGGLGERKGRSVFLKPAPPRPNLMPNFQSFNSSTES